MPTPPTPAEIRIDGKKVTINNPRDAKASGIETIYQTLALADNVDAAANLFLGRELTTRFGSLDDAAMESATRKVMGRLNPNSRTSRCPSSRCRVASASRWPSPGRSTSTPGS